MSKVKPGLSAAQQQQFARALEQARPENKAAFEKAVTIIANSDGDPAVSEREMSMLGILATDLASREDVSEQILSFANTVGAQLTSLSDQQFGLAFEGKPKVTEKVEYTYRLGSIYAGCENTKAEVTQRLHGSMAFSKLGDGLSTLSLKLFQTTPRLVEVDRSFYGSAGTVVAYREVAKDSHRVAELTLDDVAKQERKGDVINVEFLPGRMLKSMSVNTETGRVDYEESKTGLGKLTSKKHAAGYIAKAGTSEFETE